MLGRAAILAMLSCSPLHAGELMRVPLGQVEAIWLSPKSAKSEVPVSAVFIDVPGFEAMPRPVSVAEYRQFLTTHPEWQKDRVPPLYADARYLHDFDSLVAKPSDKAPAKNPNKAAAKSSENLPITNVSWFAARSFCAAQGMRLPTIIEWEYMAAASETARNANRDQAFLARILEWYGEPQGAGLKPVGSIYKNLYGIWDLHGLIWEWVEDFNSTFVTGESREDGSFNKDLFCGAGAMSSADKENYAAFMRFAFRSGLKGRSSVWNLGFRCVR